MEVLYLVFCLVVCMPAALGYGTGAPTSACTTLTPGHLKDGSALSPQTSASPYTIQIVGATTSFSPGTAIKVKFSGSEGYSGFLLQVRKDGATTPVGTWATASVAKTIDCNNAAASALTHLSQYGKAVTQEYTWTSPQDADGTYKFVGTAAKNHDMYWVNLESAAFTVGSSSQTGPTVPTANDSGESTTPENKAGYSSKTGITVLSIILAALVSLMLA